MVTFSREFTEFTRARIGATLPGSETIDARRTGVETTRRTMAKALSWQASGLVVMTAVTYAVTGSVAEGGMVAAAGSAAGMVSYVIHERIWARIAWGRQAG